MGYTKRTTIKPTEEVTDPRGIEIASALYKQFQEFHGHRIEEDFDLEMLLVQQRISDILNPDWFESEEGLVMFSPSSAYKCARELFFKAIGAAHESIMLPYQQRWVRNSSAVHEAVQRDLLYMTCRTYKPDFRVMFKNDFPCWEKNSAKRKVFTHKGVTFAIAGMMDAILIYKDGSTIGFEFKTKTNSVAQVGNYKMKGITEQHKMQCVAYSLIYGIDEFVVMYEAVAKDNWGAGEEARMDIRTFYLKVTDEDRKALLDKFAMVAKAVQAEAIPPKEPDKCMFCEYRGICQK